MLTLLKKLKESPLVTLETGVTVTEVLKREERVVGVKVKRDGAASDAVEETETIDGPVIFASGGFAGDSQGYLKKFRPDLAGFPSTNEALPGSQGLLVNVGAQLLDMDQVQVHPTGFVDPKDAFKTTKFLAAEVLRGEGGILLDNTGKRFVDELQTRKVVTDTITQTVEPSDTEPLKQWSISLVLDEGVYEAAKSHVDFYIWKGLIKKTTIGELGEMSDTALETIKQYAAIAATTGSTTTLDSLGRTSFGHWKLQTPTTSSTIYIGTVTPVVHYTMGGVVFTPEAEVLNTSHRPITGPGPPARSREVCTVRTGWAAVLCSSVSSLDALPRPMRLGTSRIRIVIPQLRMAIVVGKVVEIKWWVRLCRGRPMNGNDET